MNGNRDLESQAFRSAIVGELAELRGVVMGELGKQSRKLDEIQQTVHRIADRQLEREHEEDRYRRRLKAAEGEVERLSKQADGPDWQRDPRDITGVHNLRELSDWKKKQEASDLWWQRQRWIWVMGVLAALFVAAVSGCVTYAVSHVEVRR